MSIAPLPDVTFHPLTTGGVLSVGGSRRIWTLNDTSAFIWRILNEVGSVEEIADRLTVVFGISKGRALKDAEAALASFEREGLLRGGRPVETFERDASWDITPDGSRLVEPARWAVERCFEVANHVFEFRCGDRGLGQMFAHSISHLGVGCRRPCDTSLAVLSGKDNPQTWDVYIDGLGFKRGLPGNMVLPHLATLTFVRCCEALKNRLLFHAAVVARGREAVILPGEAGSGKTTLAAILMAHGYCVFSDELAVLNTETLSVSPLPLPMSIKLQSVVPLSRYYPKLADGAVHLRTDGKRVRYLSPWRTGRTETADSTARVALLVFPRYEKGEENRLTAVDEMEAVRRLSRTGSSNRDLNEKDMGAIVSLARSNQCYELVYADAYQAVALLEKHVLSHGLGPA